MDIRVVVLLVGAANVLITGTVTVVTARWVAKREDAKWLREQRQEAYLALMAATEVHETASEAWRNARGRGSKRQALEAVSETRADFRRARRQIWILGPKKLQKSVIALAEQFNQLSLGSQSSSMTGHAATPALRAAEEDFLKEAAVVITGGEESTQQRLPGREWATHRLQVWHCRGAVMLDLGHETTISPMWVKTHVAGGWVARVIGTDPQHGLVREYLERETPGNTELPGGWHRWHLTGRGKYEYRNLGDGTLSGFFIIEGRWRWHARLLDGDVTARAIRDAK